MIHMHVEYGSPGNMLSIRKGETYRERERERERERDRERERERERESVTD